MDRYRFIFVLVISAFFAFPTTLLYFFVMTMMPMAIFFEGNGETQFNPYIFLVFIILVVLGYSLVSLWWLVFRFTSMNSFSQVPKTIKAGLLIGVITVMVTAIFIDIPGPFASFNIYESLIMLLLLGAGPLLVLTTIIVLMAVKFRSNNRVQSDTAVRSTESPY